MFRWLVLLAVLALSAPASADELRPASILFEQVDDSRWSLGWREPVLPGTARTPSVPLLPDTCQLLGEPRLEIAPRHTVGRADVTCTGPVSGEQVGWVFSGPGEAILRVAPLERSIQVHRLTPDRPQATIEARASGMQVWRSYFLIGVDHILMGWDHLLFVIALVLLVRRGWDVVKAATAFTVAHSITLAAVTLGFAGVPQRPVEVLIALSIVFLAVEVARGTSETLTQRLPWLVAFVFGLLHGFGFAGALREIGLPEGEIPAALISFNLGVEAGQLAVIAAMLLLIWALRRFKPLAEERAIKFAAYPIGIIGAYWLVDRVVG